MCTEILSKCNTGTQSYVPLVHGKRVGKLLRIKKRKSLLEVSSRTLLERDNN